MERKIRGELLLSHPLIPLRKPFYLSGQHIIQSQAINSGDQRSDGYYQSVGPINLEATGWFSSGAH